MTVRALRLGLLAAVSCSALAAATAPSQENRKTVFVSVVDEKGKPVTDMAATDFAIREDTTDREVVAVKKTETPVSVALLVDTTTDAQISNTITPRPTIPLPSRNGDSFEQAPQNNQRLMILQ